MSSSDRRPLLRLAAIAGLSLTLAGCFRPLYSEPGVGVKGGGGPLVETLRTVDVRPIDGRVGGKMRNELIFFLRGGAAAGPVAYRLEVDIDQRGESAVVDPYSSQPDIRSVSLTATYRLKPSGSIDPVMTGQAYATASYSYSLQRFANVRAERDAEDRAAKQLAERIRTRLQGYLTTGR